MRLKVVDIVAIHMGGRRHGGGWQQRPGHRRGRTQNLEGGCWWELGHRICPGVVEVPLSGTEIWGIEIWA